MIVMNIAKNIKIHNDRYREYAMQDWYVLQLYYYSVIA